MKIIWSLLLVVMAAPHIGASAAVVPDLYKADLVVADQQDTTLKSAARKGLGEVLVKVSGRRSALSAANIRNAIEVADQYILQYGYDGAALGEDGEPGQLLQLEFDPRAVGQLLRVAMQPIWSARRPEVLIWMALDSPTGTSYVTAENSPELVGELERALSDRGLPWFFPLFDLEDEVNVGISQVLRPEEAAIANAAGRYSARAVLTGRILQMTDGTLVGDWLYLQGDSGYRIGADASPVEGLFDSVAAQIAEILSDEYAITPRRFEPGGILMYVEGIDHYADYAALVHAIESIEAVSHANVETIDGEIVAIRLLAEGSREQLRLALALGTRLVPLATSGSVADNNAAQAALSYRWPLLQGVAP